MVQESKKGRKESERHLGKMTGFQAVQDDAREDREEGLLLSPGISPSSPGDKPLLLRRFQLLGSWRGAVLRFHHPVFMVTWGWREKTLSLAQAKTLTLLGLAHRHGESPRHGTTLLGTP